MPEYGVCFPPVLLEGVICNAAKRFLPCKKPMGKQSSLLFLFFKSMDFQAWLLLTWERGAGGEKKSCRTHVLQHQQQMREDLILAAG